MPVSRDSHRCRESLYLESSVELRQGGARDKISPGDSTRGQQYQDRQQPDNYASCKRTASCRNTGYSKSAHEQIDSRSRWACDTNSETICRKIGSLAADLRILT